MMADTLYEDDADDDDALLLGAIPMVSQTYEVGHMPSHLPPIRLYAWGVPGVIFPDGNTQA